MNHGSLFSGIGGFDLAAEWMGWNNIFHCEWNPFGQKILKYYWPEAISYEDITKTDFTVHAGTIDVLSGGFPCQPYSIAGKRKGTDDDRHLWPEMLRAIREIRPSWVVGENVYGIVNWSGGLVFEQVQVDLEAQGYEVFSVLLPSAGVGGYDQRYRTWFIAYSEQNARGLSIQPENNGTSDERRRQKKKWSADWNKPELAPCSIATLTKWADRSASPEFYDGLSVGLDIDTFFKDANNGFGNAINPNVAYQIFKSIELYNNQNTL